MGVRLSDRKIPLKWFAVLLIMWIITTILGYYQQAKHSIQMESFISKGPRFTKEDGDKLEKRIEALEKKQ